MKLPKERTPYFLGSVYHTFILDVFGSCLFPQGRFCPDTASGVEQRLASFCHGSSYLYLETNKRTPGDFFTGPVHIEPQMVVGSFLEELGGLLTHWQSRIEETQEGISGDQQDRLVTSLWNRERI